jgi:hypothetical protein
MFSIKNKQAITLIELLVATISVSIIMLGVVSIDQALRQSHKSTSRNSLVSMRTSAMMLNITKVAQGATGDKSSQGIDLSLANTLCVRNEVAVSPTPGDYTDDRWICYTKSSFDLLMCTGLVSPQVCAGTSIGQLVNITFTWVDQPGSTGSGDFYLEVTITNRYDPAATKDTFDNPEIILTTRISPLAFGSSI